LSLNSKYDSLGWHAAGLTSRVGVSVMPGAIGDEGLSQPDRPKSRAMAGLFFVLAALAGGEEQEEGLVQIGPKPEASRSNGSNAVAVGAR